jgi:predicted DNA-binding transcriptional regulator YafY
MKKHDYDKILFRLLEILGRLNNGKVVNKEELSKEFGVSTRTIQKDINERLSNFIAIERVNGGYKAKDGYSIDKLLDIESEIVLIILKGLSSSMGEKFGKKAESIFAKLQNPHDEFMLSKMQIEDLSEDKQMIDKITKAISKSLEIEFYYKKNRVVRPYKIVIFEGFWYLYAQDKNDLRLKTFYLKDIKNLILGDNKFEKNENLIKKLENATNIWFDPNAKPFDVILFASGNIAKYFQRRAISKTQKILEKNDDGSIKFSMKVTSKAAILYEVKKWMPELCIISPPFLVKDMMNLINEFKKAQSTFLA